MNEVEHPPDEHPEENEAPPLEQEYDSPPDEKPPEYATEPAVSVEPEDATNDEY